jgi:hypothetical protein
MSSLPQLVSWRERPWPREWLPELPADADGITAFVVVGAGTFGGRAYQVGEVLLCGGTAATGEVVVLVASGVGRPRLGTAVGLRFLGDGGEPCHPARWRSAGKVVGRAWAARPCPQEAPQEGGNREGWSCAPAQGGSPAAAVRGEAGRPVARGGRPAAGGLGEGPPAAQLSLFAA